MTVVNETPCIWELLSMRCPVAATYLGFFKPSTVHQSLGYSDSLKYVYTLPKTVMYIVMFMSSYTCRSYYISTH